MAKKQTEVPPPNGWLALIAISNNSLDLAKSALWPVTVCFCAICVYWSVAATSGKTTFAQYLTNLSWPNAELAALILSATGNCYQHRQVRRLKEQAKLQEKKAEPAANK